MFFLVYFRSQNRYVDVAQLVSSAALIKRRSEVQILPSTQNINEDITRSAHCMCSAFLGRLKKTLYVHGMSHGSLFERGHAYRLQYSAKDSIILFNLMYGKPIDSRLFLKRKKKVFEKFISKKNCGRSSTG